MAAIGENEKYVLVGTRPHACLNRRAEIRVPRHECNSIGQVTDAYFKQTGSQGHIGFFFLALYPCVTALVAFL